MLNLLVCKAGFVLYRGKFQPMATRADLSELANNADYNKRLFLIAYGQLKTMQDAQDVVQETWKDLFAKSDVEIKAIDFPQPYILKVLIRKIVYKKGDNSKRSHIPLDNSPLPQWDESSLKKQMEEFLKGETKKNKIEILYLHFVEGYTSLQIASKINTTSGYVRKVIHDFRQQKKRGK